jgi:hypothetical protein
MREKSSSSNDHGFVRPSSFSREKACFLTILIIYVLLGIYLLPYYRYQINPDGVSYITIASKYLQGDFKNAINAFWGPMISWLLVPLLFFKIPALYAVKIQMLFVGLITLLGVRRLFSVQINRQLRPLLLFPLIPILLYFSLFAITPDLHLVCAFVFYFAVIFDPCYFSKVKNGVLCGLFGGLAFLCKSFAFPYFIIHFLLFNFLHHRRHSDSEAKKGVIKNCLWGFFIFALISGCWTILISHKYHTLTFGTAGLGAFRIVINPEMETIIEGFRDPPNATAVSFHEDPTSLIFQTNPWHITESMANLKYYLSIVGRNLSETMKILFIFSPITYLFLIILFVRKLGGSGRGLSKEFRGFALISLLLNVAGYVPMFVEERYLWVSLILFYVMGCDFINSLYHYSFPKKKGMILVMAFSLLSFTVHPSLYLLRNRGLNKEIYLLGNVLRKEFQIKGKIASNAYTELSLPICYYLYSKYFGFAKRNISPEGLTHELTMHHIDYYFLWDRGRKEIHLPYPHREVHFPGMPKLIVYEVP